MRNPIKIIRKMSRRWVLEDDIDFGIENFEKILLEEEMSIRKFKKDEKNYYKIKRIKAKTIFLSGREEECKFISISDFHCGSIETDIYKLEKILKRAQKLKIKYCCISGDLHEGINVFPGQEDFLKEKTPEGQAQIVFKILRNFNFTYIIIDGNHDLSFNANGFQNPNEILERKLRRIGIKAYYLKTFVANVIIGGVCIRLVHLDDYYGKKEQIPCLKYWSQIKEHPFINYNNKTYLIGCIQAGHVHTHAYWDTLKFEYVKGEIRKCSKKEFFTKIGYQPILVLQPGSIKRQEQNNVTEIGFITKISTNEKGNPCSFKTI